MAYEAPIEIVEIILSHLANDVPSLTRCSLVDRAWLSLCRQWQFENIDMTGYRMTSRHARFHKFMDLFEKSVPSAPCTLNQYIQGIQLDPSFTPYQIAGLDTIDLPNLRSIRIKASAVCIPTYLLSSISTTFSEKIHRLDVTLLAFPSSSAMLEFLCAFPNLQELVFGDNTFVKSAWHPPAPGAQLSSKITSLHFLQRLGIMKQEMIAWFVGQIQTRGMQIKWYKMSNGVIGWSSVHTSDFLAIVANTIEELEVQLHSRASTYVQFLTLPDTQFPLLRTLRLEPSPEVTIEAYHHTCSALDNALGTLVSSLDAPSLSALSLSLSQHSAVSVCPMHAFLGAHFGRLDDALSSTERNLLPILRTVEFLLPYCGSSPTSNGRCVMSSDSLSTGDRLEDTGEGASKQASSSLGDTFDGLASQFLQEAVPQTLRQRKIALLVSRVAM